MTASVLNFWHAAFQLVAIISAALAFIAGAGTFWTGHLKDKAAAAAELQLRDQIKRESDARTALEQKSAGRRILPAKRDETRAALRPYAGQRYSITAAAGDPEAARYAEDLDECLRAAGWANIHGTEVTHTMWMGRPPSAFLQVPANVQSWEEMPSLGPITMLLANTGNTPPISVSPSGGLEAGMLEICIGPKEPI